MLHKFLAVKKVYCSSFDTWYILVIILPDAATKVRGSSISHNFRGEIVVQCPFSDYAFFARTFK